MTTEQREKWILGRGYYREYHRVNRNEETSMRLSREGIAKLAKTLDLTQRHIREHIEFYLWQ